MIMRFQRADDGLGNELLGYQMIRFDSLEAEIRKGRDGQVECIFPCAVISRSGSSAHGSYVHLCELNEDIRNGWLRAVDEFGDKLEAKP